MNKLTLFFLSIIGTLPFCLKAQSQNGYEITGHITGLKDGSKVIMSLETNALNGVFIPSDSAYAKDGTFLIKGVVPEGPRFYKLILNNGKFLFLFINNGEHISIRYDVDIYHKGKVDITSSTQVDGSPTNNSWHNIVSGYYVYWLTKDRINNYLKNLKNSVGFDTSLVHTILVCKNQLTNVMYEMLLNKDHLAPTTPSLKYIHLAYANNQLFNDAAHDSIFVNVYNKLDESERNSYYGRELKEKIKLCVGQPFPDFNLPASDGKLIQLKDITSKSKITIVHFWSSEALTSVVRNQYQTELRAMYKMYHDKGLNIIGVAADDSSSEYSYKKILREEQFPWPSVCDLKGKEGVVAKVYKEYGPEDLPRPSNVTNYLIDNTGKIIAYDLTGVELQYYIWKYTKEDIADFNKSNNSAVSKR